MVSCRALCLKSTLMGNFICCLRNMIHQKKKKPGLAKITIKYGYWWVIREFTISTKLLLLKTGNVELERDVFEYNFMKPCLPKDVVAVGSFRSLPLPWFLVDFKCPV